MNKGDIVKFKDMHKWSGVLGYIDTIINSSTYLIAVPTIERGIKYIRVTPREVIPVGYYHREEGALI